MIITLSGSFLYVLMSLLSKKIGEQLLINQIIFLQSFSGLLCAIFFLKLQKYTWQQFFTEHKTNYLPRIAMSLVSTYALIDGLQYMSVFNALLILNSAPLIIPVLRRLFYNKKIHPLIFPAVFVAFAGLACILAPDRHIFEAPVFIVLFSMLCLSFSLLLLEINKNTDPNLSIFYYFFYSTLIIGTILFFKHQVQSISLHSLPTGIAIGILFFFIQLSVIYASEFISSQLISVLFYTEIIMALGVSILFENLQFKLNLLFGTLLVILGGVAVVFIEHTSKMLKKR